MKLGFIGTGNLATAILRGVVASGMTDANEIAIFDINEEKTAQLGAELSVKLYDGLYYSVISEQTGFCSASYFRKIVKQMTGLSPREIRRSMRGEWDV